VVTEADVRLLPTLLRFDAVYAPLFLRMAQCSLGNSGRYPHIRTYMATLYALPNIKDTIQWQPLVNR
jgi:putative glutathione S-transferase